MGKHSRCVIDIYNNEIQYPEMHKKHNNVDGDIIMYKLPKDGAVKAAWSNTILKGRKQLIQQSFRTFLTASLFGWLINPSEVFNKINPSPVR